MVRSLNARIVASTKPDSFKVSVWIATCTSILSATARQLSMAAGVVPQSSWSFSPTAPAFTCSLRGSGRLALPLPKKPRFMGNASAAESIEWICQCPGVQVVAQVAVADYLAAAEFHFLAVYSEVLFDLDPELGVREAHAVAGRRPEHFGIGLARDLHSSAPITLPVKP